MDFDLSQLVENLATMFQLRCQQKGLNWRTEYAELRFGRVVHLAPGYALRVLVVDDVATNRDILAQVLEHIGAEVGQVKSGAEALEILHEQHFDIAFIDIRMPDMGGIELLSQMRRQHHSLPAVAISASVMKSERQHYLECGFNTFVDKPFRLESIYACLDELLDVQYEYAPPLVAEDEAAVVADSFSGMLLSPMLRARLRQAAEMHNVTEVKLCLDEMRALGARETLSR